MPLYDLRATSTAPAGRSIGTTTRANAFFHRTARAKASRCKRPAHPEAQVGGPIVGGVDVAVGRAKVQWTEVPRTAAHHPASCIFITFHPSTPIGGRRRYATVAVMVRVFDPLPDITLHVVKPERVRWKLSH